MKNLILIIMIIAFVGCKEEAPTKNDKILTEYTIEQLENDTNWVEITDIDTLSSICVLHELFDMGKLCRNYDEYLSLYNLSKSLPQSSEMPCSKNDTNILNVDFSKRSLILFAFSIGGKPLFERRIFKNIKLNQYRYVLEITRRSSTYENSWFTEPITVPKIPDGMEMVFDTLNTGR